MSGVPRTKVHSFGYGPGLGNYLYYKTIPSAPWRKSIWVSFYNPVALGSRVDQLLISRGNPAPYARLPQNGGDFLQHSFERRHKPYVFPKGHRIQQNPSNLYENIGALYAGNVAYGTAENRSWTTIRSIMEPMGTVGWNRFSPGTPLSSLSQFLGELHQLPKNPFRMAAGLVRSMRTAGSKAAGADMLRRSVGDHYLNWSFGWRPFLNDLEKIANFNERYFRALDQLYRDHGKTVRRRGTISQTSTTTVTEVSGGVNAYVSAFAHNRAGTSKRTVSTTVNERFWFSAGFNYRLPSVNDQEGMNNLRQYLMGGGISPSVIWELTPWSWLADYFTNIGDTLENWEKSRAISLAARYAYVMYKRDVTVRSEHSVTLDTGFQANMSHISRTITQARRVASAYGFGFTSGQLNNGQIANLVALGLSRRI